MEEIEFEFKTDIEEYLAEEVNIRILTSRPFWQYYSDNNRLSEEDHESALQFFNHLYSDFHMFKNYMNQCGIIANAFGLSDFNSKYIGTLVHYYGVELTEMGESSLAIVNEIAEGFGDEQFSNDYEDAKISKILNEFEELGRQPDSKHKLARMIKLKGSIFVKHFCDTHQTTLAIVSKKLEGQIESLERIIAIGLLPESTVQSSQFKLALKKKTDFIKIISAMYDAHMFETEDGFVATNKQGIFDEFSKVLNENFTAYSTILSKSKNTERDTFLKPFEVIRSKAEAYFDKDIVK